MQLFRTVSSRALTALVLAVLVLAAAPAVEAQPDFSRYVSLGDSLTAGFTSSSLVETAQANSYPAIIHRQATGGGGFEQPLVTTPGIPPVLGLRSLTPLVIAPITPAAQQGVPANLFLPRPYDNLAVPGARVGDVLRTVSGGLHDVVLRPSPAGAATQLQQALSLQPTFVSLWIGNNDALAAATSGIVIEGVTLTPLAAFEADFRAIVGAVAASGADMAIATVPNVTAIPFTSALPPVLVDPATGQPVLVGGNPVPLIGPSGPLGPNDRVLLTASAALAQGIGIPAAAGGTGQPLGDNFVLSAAEVATITQRVAGFNSVIRAVAGEVGAAVVDINVIFDRVQAEGLHLGGLTFTTEFLRGGLFSFDGVHASAFGYAFVANEFIKAINASFNADIPQVDLFTASLTPDPTTLIPATLAASEVRSVIYTRGAYESLRKALAIPPTELLLGGGFVKPDGGGPGGGDSGGSGGDDDDDGGPPPPAPPVPPRPVIPINLP